MQNTEQWNVLVVDSDKEFVKVLQEQLAKESYDVIYTADGEKGYQLLIDNPDKFATIILGDNIPNHSAINFIYKINSVAQLKTIPIIMESSNACDEMEKYIRAGVRYYLAKPIDEAILPAIISASIRDWKRYKDEEHATLQIKPINTLTKATFKIRTLYDAQNVAAILANECPNPRLAAVGIGEILINAIEHGNLNITYQEKTKLHESATWLTEIDKRLDLPENVNKFVTIIFTKNDDNINIRVIDQGEGFDWRQYQSLDTNRVYDNHGRGIIMAKSLSFENLIYHGKGNDVECIIPIII